MLLCALFVVQEILFEDFAVRLQELLAPRRLARLRVVYEVAVVCLVKDGQQLLLLLVVVVLLPIFLLLLLGGIPVLLLFAVVSLEAGEKTQA